MELSKKQEEGLKIAIERFRHGDKYTVIAGYAGTGKSTLVKFIVAALAQYGIDSEKDVVFTSFTGKATQVLQRKGNKNVSTLHKLLYEWKMTSEGKYIKEPLDFIPYKVAVVDEISMVPNELLKQLATHDVYILCLGDPYQLSPVDKNEDNHLLDHPHIFLDEIMRQAAESEIIQLTMKIRNGEKIEPFKGKEVQVLSKEELNTGMLLWADQVICAKNNTRIALNQQMRELLGLSGPPQEGDKVICLRNDWDTISTDENPLVNGTVGTIHNLFNSFIIMPPFITKGRLRKLDYLAANFMNEDGDDYGCLALDKKLFEGTEGTLTSYENYKLSGYKPLHYFTLENFTYGYAITAHKSQGSEWNKVLVIEENFPFGKEDHARWLYTACTRASSRLVLILDK